MTADPGSIVLARFPRGPRDNPEAEVLVLSLDTFTPPDRPDKPARYVNLRVWFRGPDGTLRPTKRGITLRRGELYKAIKVLCGAARALGVDLHPQREGSDHAAR